MATTEENWHTLPDGNKLYTKTWKPKSPPVALVVFIHGFSDHCNTYGTLFPSLAAKSIQTFAFDQRGWGRSVTSPSTRGLTGSTALVLDDITSILQLQLPPPVPLFLMGHSMGGAEVLYYAARGPVDIRRQITGYLIESPWIALHPATQPSRALVVAGRLAAKLAPRRQMVQKVEPKWVSRDEEVCKAFKNDELCHDTGTLEGLAGMLSRAAELDNGQVELKDRNDDIERCRVWLGHGNQDRVTSFAASQRFMERIGVRDKEFKIYDGWYHKRRLRDVPDGSAIITEYATVHAEPGEDKITFANDVASWILSRINESENQTLNELQTNSRL